MRYLITLLLIMLYWPVSVYAACDGQVIGWSSKVVVFIGYENDCGGGKYLISWRNNRKDKSANEEKSVPFDEECKPAANGGFSCKADGRSPLAGTTYIVTKDAVDYCDESGKGHAEQYTCVKGCDNPIVPKHIEIRPYEC